MIIATGVGTMHYVGMAAVIIDATQEWIVGIIILSILIAFIVSFVGLLLLLFIDGIYGQCVSCLIIGLAVCVAHYTGMYAVRYYENDNTEWILNMDDRDGFQFTARLISTVSGCISTMILISYHIVKFYHYKNTNVYRKRYGNIIINTNVFGLLYIVFGSFSIFIEEDTFVYVLNEFFVLFAFYAFLASLLLRYLLAWYSLNLLAAKESLTWQTILNSKLKDIAAESFFFKNHLKYGNIKWLSKRIYFVFICVLFINFMFFAITFTDQDITIRRFAIPIFILLITLILITYFFRHTPGSFKDELYIFGEMKLNALILLFMFLTTICGYIFIETDNFGLYYTFVSMICVTIIAIIPIEILLHKQQKPQKSNKSPKQKLSECLSNMESFSNFMKHLNKECAMEVLLFIVEHTQWRNYWGKKLGVIAAADSGDNSPKPDPSVTDATPDSPDTTEAGHVILTYLRQASVTDSYNVEIKFTLPKDMPMAIIVNGYKNELVDNKILTEAEKIRYCKESAYKLYEKYILPRSEFEVNISYMCRNELKFMFNDYDEWMKNDNIPTNELICIFDSSCVELYRLLDQPYTRFLMY